MKWRPIAELRNGVPALVGIAGDQHNPVVAIQCPGRSGPVWVLCGTNRYTLIPPTHFILVEDLPKIGPSTLAEHEARKPQE